MTKDNDLSICHIVKHLRISSKLTQDQMANFLGIDPLRYSLCENGQCNYFIEELERLRSLFRVRMSVFIDGLGKDWQPQNLSGYSTEDLRAIADVNRIALNIDLMKTILAKDLRGNDISTSG